jgi:hypothetical protein
MESRGYNHKSPLKAFSAKKAGKNLGKINIKANEKELSKRCKNCKFKKRN